MSAGVKGSDYAPTLKTRKRLERIGTELQTASPMRLLAKMRLEGFSDRAVIAADRAKRGDT